MKPTLQRYNCIFLNITLEDFIQQPSRNCRPFVTGSLGLPDHGGHSTVMASSFPPSSARMPCFIPVELPPVRICSKEARLLDYFTNFIAPKCATDIGINPYLNIVLPIAARSPSGPLFRIIMAVASIQLYNLGHAEEALSSMELHGLALTSLRNYLAGNQQSPEETIITTLMMGFLEVSCPQYQITFSYPQYCSPPNPPRTKYTDYKLDTRKLPTLMDLACRVRLEISCVTQKSEDEESKALSFRHDLVSHPRRTRLNGL